jgi:hypothetical protein
MSLKQDVTNLIDNVKDGVNEAVHKTNAEDERVQREAAGDALTPGEKASSIAREATNNVQAGIDKAKLDIRNAGK